MSVITFYKSVSTAQSSSIDQFYTLYWAQAGKVWRVAERISASEHSGNTKAYPTRSFVCCQTMSQEHCLGFKWREEKLGSSK